MSPTQMGQVISIDPASWIAMRELRASIKNDTENNEDGKRDICIRKEKAIYKEIMSPFLSSGVA